MKIQKRWFADFKPQEIEEIRLKQETVVVVDLWAATTNIVLMLRKKPERLIVVNDEKYLRAKEVYQDAVLVGQSTEIPQDAFASSTNQSFDVDQVDVAGKIVFYLSFNGTRVLEAFSTNQKGLLFVGALSNYESLVHHLRRSDVENVHIVASGNLTGEMGGVVFIEDLMGGEVIEKKLKGGVFDFEVFSGQIKRAMLSYHPEDLQEAEEKIWPYIFGPQVKILPTAFVNEEGFVEVVDYGPS